jgi:hypothetical protein
MTGRDFWTASGWHLLEKTAQGRLRMTPEFMQAYFGRVELLPDESSGAVEIALHSALLNDPMRVVGDQEVHALGDEAIVHNYRVVLGFRDFLVANDTLEAAYLKIVRGESGLNLPKLFVDQMVHVILRQILDGALDPMRVRAGELFFREQTVSTDGGRVMLADDETVEMYAETGGMGGIGQLLAQSATPMRRVELDVLDEDNAAIYWKRSDRFDTVVDFRYTQPALDAFARVLEAWVRHFLEVEVRVQPMQRIDDEQWRWHIGLDAEATRILNGLYHGEEPAPGEEAQMISLFRLDIEDQDMVATDVRGRPVYLGLAMTGDSKLQMKPQNLIVNLPLEQRA